jgi:hypothetical protein
MGGSAISLCGCGIAAPALVLHRTDDAHRLWYTGALDNRASTCTYLSNGERVSLRGAFGAPRIHCLRRHAAAQAKRDRAAAADRHAPELQSAREEKALRARAMAGRCPSRESAKEKSKERRPRPRAGQGPWRTGLRVVRVR